MSVRRLPRQMGLWVCCDGTDEEDCPERKFSATIRADYNRDWLKKNEGWGRGLTKGRKRRDLCPKHLELEQKLLVEETAKTEAWKRERAERKKALASPNPLPKKPRKRKASTAVSAGAVTEAEEANIGQPLTPTSSPSAA